MRPTRGPMAARETVLVAMSGGVDSSVVAGLLKRRGYDVIGMTMQIWQESQTDPRHAGCCSLGAVEDARRVARILDIPHYVLNFKEQFRKAVIEDFIEEYGRGRTPNPCVQCNRRVKFENLFEKLDELGCSKLATGHYARIRRDSASGAFRLLRARAAEKDQSYVLYMLNQRQLGRVMFPLGELGEKAETRAMAREMALPVAEKPDSQEICFVNEAGGYVEFLRKERPEMFESGDIVDTAGKRIGEHGGLAAFTVGQRRGIGITPRDGKPLFVLKLEPKENRLVVGSGDDLRQREVALEGVHWIQGESGLPRQRVRAKIRYNMVPEPAVLVPGESPKLVFDRPVRAVTPGQIAVAYRGQTVVAGGTIASSQPG